MPRRLAEPGRGHGAERRCEDGESRQGDDGEAAGEDDRRQRGLLDLVSGDGRYPVAGIRDHLDPVPLRRLVPGCLREGTQVLAGGVVLEVVQVLEDVAFSPLTVTIDVTTARVFSPSYLW